MADKGILYIAAAFYGAPGSGLGKSIPHTSYSIFHHGQINELAQLFCQQRSLIIATLSQPLGVQGHRYYYLAFQGMGTQVLSKKLAQRGGYRLEVPVLELEDSLASGSLKQEQGTDAIDGE